MNISYRGRRLLKSLAVTLLVLVLAAAAVLAVWLLWLNRYIVYTDDGAKLDFGLSRIPQDGIPAEPPEPDVTVEIHYSDEVDPILPDKGEMVQLNGFYITGEMLKNIDALRSAVEQLPAGSTVMLDVKTVKGEYYYSSKLGRHAGGVSAEKMDSLIAYLKKRNCYIIARLPAFREYWYILEDESHRVAFGLPRKGGSGALWLDKSGPNYWLNPASDGTISHLIDVVTEIRTMGFDEAVFTDFKFPDTNQISFDGDRQAALNKAAQDLVKTCATKNFTLSFESSDASLQLPDERCRMYLTGVEAAGIDALVQKAGFKKPALSMVFLTDRNDTRFDEYGVLRPLYIPEN